MSDGSSKPGQTSAAALSSARRLYPGDAGHPALDRLSTTARRIIGSASAQVSLIADTARTVGSSGVPASEPGETPLSQSLCARTASQGRPLTVSDTRADPLTAHLPAVGSGLVGSFLGVPITADDGSTVGALCVFDPAPRLWRQDEVGILEALADSAAAELELAALTRDFDASRARWDLAIHSAGVGTFDWDLRTGELAWDQTLIDMFGYGDDDVFAQTIEAFNDRLHPDDVPGVTQALQRAIDTVGDYEADYRIVLPSGEMRDIQARGRALGEGGVSLRVLGAAWDVTATRSSQERAGRLVEAMPVAYVRVGADGLVEAANQLAERLLHVSRLDLDGKVLWDVVPETLGASLDAVCTRVVDTGRFVQDELFLAAPIDAWVELRAVPDDECVSLFFTDISERRRERAAAERVAEHDRRVAEALQDALLTRLPERDDLQLRARYVTAARGDRVGGDWYDAVIQTDGATTVVVGDVVGHDIAAAAVMGQLRSILRAFVWQADHSPAQVTSALDRAMHDLYPTALATLVAARVEQDDDARARRVHTLRWTNCGHLPPVVVEPDGTSRVLDAQPDLLLGVQPDWQRRDNVVELRTGCTLVLYTDGLVERRHQHIDVGIGRLAESLRRHRDLGVDELIEAVLADLLDEEVDDDVVLVVVRLNPQP